MGEQKRRAAATTISVLIPERGRPAMLHRLIRSLIETAGDDRRYEILVAIDDDDPEWPGDACPEDAGAVRWFRWPRPATLGDKLNALAEQAGGGILWFIANDYVMETVGWPAKFREAVVALPSGIGVVYPHDDLHPGHAAFPIITRKMADAVSFFMPPWFAAGWFIDTWWDQVGILLDIHREIDVVVRAPEGRGQSHGLRDVTFWATFFNAMLMFRVRDAIGLAKIAYGEGSEGLAGVLENIEVREYVCGARTRHLEAPEFAAKWEARAIADANPHYAAAKASAENMLRNIQRTQEAPAPRVAIAVPSGRSWEASTANCVAALAAYSATAGINIACLNVQSSQITHGRNTTVKLAMEAGCEWVLWIDSDMKFSPDALVRLLAHRQSIVGATYNKRVPKADGSYETLGRFVQSAPTLPALREAELLPGGLLLVSMDVYRNLGWPWYAETYRWPGDDGLVAFQGMLRDYFQTVPPDFVLASLQDTVFGAWVKDNYAVGVGDYPMFSEDLFFCQKARRAGYRIWCDLSVTNETAHIGQIDVTCKVPDTLLS